MKPGMIRTILAIVMTGAWCLGGAVAAERPNILFCIADDWGWPDAGFYGDPAVKTPAFDHVAREGVLFDNAFVTSPSCTPSRNSILTGQWHWRLGAGAHLWSSLAPEHPVYPRLLENAGYHVGHWRKGWGPGDWRALGRTRDPAGDECRGFGEFFTTRPAGRPFCFWLGSSDPHRPYEAGTSARAGIDPARVRVPDDLPDHAVVRGDLADYLLEVQRFDGDVAAALVLLERAGELENTIVVVTGDHGMPFPRHKCNLHDSGTHVPLAIRWPAGCRCGSTMGWPYADCDDGPTMRLLMDGAGDPALARFHDLAFAKRPAEELYDLAADPGQLVNVADDPARAAVKAELARRLDAELAATGDPRSGGGGDELEAHPYYGGMAPSRLRR